MRRRRLTGGLAALLLAPLLLATAVTPAHAHRGHSSLAVVEIDAKSGALSVTHILQAHDVEPALVDLAPDAQPSLDDPDAMAALVAYLGRQFRIAGVALSPAGQRLSGDKVELRYIGRLKGKPAQLRISGSLFGDSYDDHQTQVNVRRAGITRTLLFGPADPARSLAIPGR